MASDDEQSGIAETPPESMSPQTSVVNKPKRLTLQERLAAAAKAKRNKAEKEVAPAPVTAPDTTELKRETESMDLAVPEVHNDREKTDIEGETETNLVDSECTSQGKTPDPADTESETVKAAIDVPADATMKEATLEEATVESERPDLVSDSARAIELQSDVQKEEIYRLNSEIVNLKAKLESQRKETRPGVSSKDVDRKLAEKEKALSQCEKKMRDKEETIRQLMEEGQELLKKELKSNERIRLLVAANTKLEASLRSYAEKNEESLLKLGEIEDLVKLHKLKSVDQLFEVLGAASQKSAELQAALVQEKECNWEGKYKEAQRLFEKELAEKRGCQRQLSEAHVQLELLQNQSRLELLLKSDIIAQMNREIMAAKDESSTEVLRLEAKIESLRIENESFLKTPNASSSDPNCHGSTKKMVDYVDFLKLSESHQNLQAQYVSLQENWKLIESSLLSKADALSSSVESLKSARTKSAAELKRLHSKLNSQLDEIEALKADVAARIEQNSQHELRFQMKCAECTELEEKIDELQAIFSADRKNYDAKIQSLTETIEGLESHTPTFTPSISFDNLAGIQGIQGRRGIREGGLQITIDPRQPALRKSSSHSVVSSAMVTPSQGWENPSFVSENGLDSHMYENINMLLFLSTDEIFPSEALDVGDTPLNSGFGSQSAVSTKHIQIINKMSGNIRRLEVEILTLREENAQLIVEIETAQLAISDKLELETQLREVESRVSVLQSELEQKTNREGTLLEVIGEKSEKVAELEADVVDLKDLMRQQVQQMIEMQGK